MQTWQKLMVCALVLLVMLAEPIGALLGEWSIRRERKKRGEEK